ncbi:hypothetical protein K435DRAFT_865445 [Dendrothele bispora CBS 962.96]|uniref:Uncharacterized protein n=1 Tax=Dendrothele bispora (strain CBS 962.96) TaxID=1314807 RepID=A0A4S8LJZ7_DENBC|nr:hypothetical protein K435DRAFT_865445 [Dendrothele bispora CBS 962.96]
MFALAKCPSLNLSTAITDEPGRASEFKDPYGVINAIGPSHDMKYNCIPEVTDHANHVKLPMSSYEAHLLEKSAILQLIITPRVTMTSFHMYDEHYSNTDLSSMLSTHNFYGIPMQADLDNFDSNNYQAGHGFDSGHGDNVLTDDDPNLGPFSEPHIDFGWPWGETDHVPFHVRIPSVLSNLSTGQDSSSPNEMVIPPQSVDIVFAVPTTTQLSYTQTSQVLIPSSPSTSGFLREQDKQRLSGVNQYHHTEDTRAGRSHEKFCDGPQDKFSTDQYSLLTLSTAWEDGSLQPLFNQGIHDANGDTGNIQDHSINENKYMTTPTTIIYPPAT